MEGNIEGRPPSATTPEAQDPSIIVSLNELEDEAPVANQLSSMGSSANEDHRNEVEFGYVFNAWVNDRDDDKLELFHDGRQDRIKRSSEVEESLIECKQFY